MAVHPTATMAIPSRWLICSTFSRRKTTMSDAPDARVIPMDWAKGMTL
jgi:hypothetical protein